MPLYPLTRTPIDGLKTKTSQSQTETEDDMLELLLPWTDLDLIQAHLPPKTPNENTPEIKPNSKSIKTAQLLRSAHGDFLNHNLQGLPSEFTALDASRSWLMFWAINSLTILDIPYDRQRAIDTILSFQDPKGGFGAGPRQSAHLASTFACITTLSSLLGRAEPELVKRTWSRVDRDGMYRWIMSLKRPEGGFVMQINGEVDVRGCYCVLVVATLLNFLTPELASDLPQFISGCQTYEGGFSSGARQLDLSSSVPLGESHGGYASCGLLAHFMLSGLSNSVPTGSIDLDACRRWLTNMQALPIEGGGFRGRTNKLVDGCYSWWCGGLFPVLDQLIREDDELRSEHHSSERLYDRSSLQEYTILLSQDDEGTDGGLSDKPSMAPDIYHTHYGLCGLSSAQHFPQFSSLEFRRLQTNFDSKACLVSGVKGMDEDEDLASERMGIIYSRALAWMVDDTKQSVIGLPENLVQPIHPIFNIHPDSVKVTMDHFYGQN